MALVGTFGADDVMHFLRMFPTVWRAENIHGQLDPYVAKVLSQESMEIQRTIVSILTILRSIARSHFDVGFAEYIRGKYPGTDEDTITLI